MTGIQSFSSDILGYIFEHLYSMQNEDAGGQDDDAFGLDPRPGEVSLSDPTLFPCAIARVSRSWRATAANFSKFWTRFVFDLGADPGMFLDAVNWSRDMEFSTLIFDSRVRAVAFAAPSAEDERRRVWGILAVLQPHLPRCISLSFDLFHSSSIPSPPWVLGRVSLEASTLKLESRFAHPIPEMSPQWYTPNGTAFVVLPHMENLTTLSLDISTFMKLGEMKKNWWSKLLGTRNLSETEKISLILSNYEFGHRKMQHRYTIQDFFEGLRATKFEDTDISLTLRNLSVRLPFPHSGHPGEYREAMDDRGDRDCILLENLSTDFMFSFCAHFSMWAEKAKIDRCGIPFNARSLGGARFQLYNLSERENLIPLFDVTRWICSHLTIENCPSFNDNVLLHITQKGLVYTGDSGSESSDIPIRFSDLNVKELYLSKCNSISVEGLKKLVEGRKLDRLEIMNMPAFSELETLHWFQERVEHFKHDFVLEEGPIGPILGIEA